MLNSVLSWWNSDYAEDSALSVRVTTQEKLAEACDVRKATVSLDKVVLQPSSLESSPSTQQQQAFTPTTEAPHTPSTQGSASRHGFTDSDDYDSSPSPSFSFSSQKWGRLRPVSRHGFCDAPSDSEGEGEHDSDGENSSRNWNNLFLPASPSPKKGHPLFASSPAPPSPRSRSRSGSRRAFELQMSPPPPPAAAFGGVAVDDLGELRELSRRLQGEAVRRDALRERTIEREQQRRKELLDSDALTQRQLMRKFEQEEAALQRARQAKAQEVAAVLAGDAPFRPEDLSALLKQVHAMQVPVPSGTLAELEGLIHSAADLLQKLGALTAEMRQAEGEAEGGDGSSPAEMDQLRMFLQHPLCKRMLAAGGSNETILQGVALLEAQSQKADLQRKAREEIELPALPQLHRLRRKVASLGSGAKGQGQGQAAALALAFDVEELLLLSDPSVAAALSKKQRLQLWVEVFQLIIDGAAGAADEASVRAYSQLTFGLFYLLHARKSEALVARAGKVFVERLHRINSVCVPVFAAREAETVRGHALRNVVQLFGGVVALGLEKPVCVSHATAWTWLVRTVKLLQKAVLKLQESRGGGAEKDSALCEELSENALDATVALRAFLSSGGGVLLSERYRPLFFDPQGGVLAGLRLALDAYIEQFLPSFSYIPAEKREFTELKAWIDAVLQAQVLEESAEEEAGEDELRAAMLSQLAEKRRFQALQVMAVEEYRLTAPLLQPAVDKLCELLQQGQTPPLPMLKAACESCFALVNFLKACGCTLSAEQRALLFDPQGQLDRLVHVLTAVATQHGEAAQELLQNAQTLLAAGFTDAAPTSKDRYAMCARNLALVTEKRRLCGLHALGMQEFGKERETDSIPYKLNTVPGMLSKTTVERLLNGLVDRVLAEKPHLLLFALATIAKEVVDKCSSENFSYKIATNPVNIVATIHGIIASTGSDDFVIFIKAELYRKCPQCIPRVESSAEEGLSNGAKSCLVIYGLCCVRSGGFASPDDAWKWLANLINWCRKQPKARGSQGNKPCLELPVLDMFNLFLRVVSEEMHRIYGQHYLNLLRTILRTVVPLIKHPVDAQGRAVDDKLSEFLREAIQARFLPIFG